MDIVSALRADQGICCFVGAGGKKTTMYTLANRLERAVVTATVRIPMFDNEVQEVTVTDRPRAAIDRTDRWPIGVVPEREGGNRYRGYATTVVNQLADGGVPILVKADGARMRLFKAPDEHEPQIPQRARTIVPIASAHVVGKPLNDEHVHRVDRVAELTGLARGDPVTPAAVGRVLAHERGGLKDVPEGATVVPLINMVDDDSLAATGREIADVIHGLADVPHVVLGKMCDDRPLVGLV